MKPESAGQKLTPPVSPRDHTCGGADAAIVLVEYADFESPQCATAYMIAKNIRRHYGDRLKFVFRNFAISEQHPHSEDAAQLAEAAAEQGKFWEMHDTLFEHPHALEHRDLLGYAIKLALDIERVRSELEQRVYLPRVHDDRKSGEQSGVLETPTFFVNGERFDGPWNEHEFIEALEAHLKRHDG